MPRFLDRWVPPPALRFLTGVNLTDNLCGTGESRDASVDGYQTSMNLAERVRGGATKARMVARCLGAFRLEDASGNELQFRTRKARAILAILALHGRPLSRNALADLLWSDRGPVQARASLRQTIFELQHLDWSGAALLVAGRDDVSPGRDALVTDLQLIRTASASGDWPRLLTLLEIEQFGAADGPR